MHVFSYGRDGHAAFVKVIPVPPPVRRADPAELPADQHGEDRLARPAGGLARRLDAARAAEPRRLGRDRRHRRAARSATSTSGTTPTAPRSCRGKHFGLVTNETPGTVSVIDLAEREGRQDDPGRRAPLAPRGDRARPTRTTARIVAIANSDRVAVIDTDSFALDQTLSVARAEGIGASPTALDGRATARLLVAESGADDLAVFGLRQLRLVGRIPTAEYPTDVAVAPAASSSGSAPRASGPGPTRTGRTRSRRTTPTTPSTTSSTCRC